MYTIVIEIDGVGVLSGKLFPDINTAWSETFKMKEIIKLNELKWYIFPAKIPDAWNVTADTE